MKFKEVEIQLGTPTIPRLCSQRDCINNTIRGCKTHYFDIIQMNRVCKKKIILEKVDEKE